MLLRGMWLAVPAVVAACSFPHGALGGDAQGLGSDDSGTNIEIDAPLEDAPVDVPAGQTCVGTQGSLLVYCFMPGTEPTMPWNPTQNFDSTDPAQCDHIKTQSNGNPELCIKNGTSITISGNVRFTGPRPVVLLSLTTISVSGSIDVSNNGAGADKGNCNSANKGTDEFSSGSSKGAGGGGGGGFGTGGGRGGTGSQSGGNGGQQTALTAIRGGCRGASGGSSSSNPNGGSPGAGGGAVYLMAGQSITVNGTINASGGGGHGGSAKAGGGGGGSGGLIGFDAPSVTVTGTAFANGGGGGEGGDSNTTGENGSVASRYDQATPGGNNLGNGGDGGLGAYSTYGGGNGSNGNNAGGGGGGGVGNVRRYPRTMPLTGKISPPAS